ncbi:branched-chain amino acid transport system ATP-binding protein [Paucibacter oligotrophus]|uniref:Branched-chain amino acid transport system ATP-binding protein n=1 Tax=Roseateles oligotrophus TaxID=1769250 RepID=A0A840L8Y6_9BURK|nr:ATP-binding cassette domain-containing protein [Roseateles oligotrophus]MBB4845044.1 branched-chain amino acid transport system ATP-binding protein [Roseateles oligotrophus]
MIDIQNLSVAFWGVKAIDGLTAQLSAPVCGLIGPNGAGKTTLVNLLSGLVPAAEGQVLLNGQALLGKTPIQRVRLGLRRSFQTEQVVEDLSVWDNVRAMLDHVPHERGSVKAQLTEVLEFTELSAVATRLGRQLNLFQRRMVEVAKALVGTPRLLLFDEPGAGLTEQESLLLRAAILAIPQRFGAQVLLIDHDVDLIKATCSQTLVMDFGQCLALGPTAQVLDDPAVRRAYLGG